MPIPPRHFVPRVRLWARLDESTKTGVTLVTGLVGTGKTLGIVGWLRARGHDRGDAIWVQADAGLGPEPLGELFHRASSARRDGAAGDGPGLVVIDDAHELPAASVRLIDTLLRESPTSMRLVLASRWDLALTRFVPELLGHLTVLRGDLLRMTDAEAAALVEPRLKVRDRDVVRSVVEWSRGWCAILVLTAHAAGQARDPAAAVRRLAEGAAPVADQVASEVFTTMTPAQRHLLICLSGEDPFSVQLATHLTGDRQAAEILAELETTGLLVTRAPAPGALGPAEQQVRFVIHPLLLEVVRRRLAVEGDEDVARAREAMTHAVRLDLSNGHTPHALTRLLRLGARDEAAEVLSRDGVRMLLGPAHSEEVARAARTEPEMVDLHPGTWFPVALDRWLADDAEGIRHWTNRIIEAWDAGPDDDGSHHPFGAPQVAVARLWRAKLGLEPLPDAVAHARQVASDALEPGAPDAVDGQVLPVLLLELGTAQAWMGLADQATADFTAALTLCRSQGLTALMVATMSHLALAELMAGREHAAAEVATEVVGLLGEEDWRLRFAPSRAAVTLFLSSAAAAPWQTDAVVENADETALHTHGCDLTARFWSRVREAVLAVRAGSVMSAQRALAAPVADPQLRDAQLPSHLRVGVLLGEGLLAGMSADPTSLERIEADLASLGAAGEACFVAGLRADCHGDRRGALAAFGEAAQAAVCVQPPARAMGLACAAQLMDSMGSEEAALDRLAQAAALTEVRRSGVPFLGWARQGSPMEALLRRLDTRGGSAWVHELAALAAGHADVISALESSTSMRREQRAVDEFVVPSLTPREREVLGELARGATYADIGAALFLSVNTVKTHISSLYTKLGVARRSDALAVARSHHVL